MYLHRSCWRVLKGLFLCLCVFLFLLVWVQFPLQQETFKMNLELQKKLDKLTVKLQECSQEENGHKKFLEDSRPKIPSTVKKKIKGFSGKRIVHLDLKGAPPKMEYLLKILPYLKDMGANGVLIEYEDMFPYHGRIRVLSSPNAYSYEEISTFLASAKQLDMEVIPLIQTLGHFEFVLKHEQFRFLRETSNYPNMPCPLHEQTQEIVFKMINQVLALHPHVKRIHLGGDEVFNMNDCDKCKSSGKSKERLFLHHMMPILEHVKSKTKSKVKPIIWDDMLRKWSVEDMKKLYNLADIMVWGYVPELEHYSLFPEDMWEKYGEAFDSIWVASSFKGALAANNDLVPIRMHIKNHESWLRVMKKTKNKVAGIALTGWARYDHFAALCELLPAALPTLALSLSVLREGAFKNRGKDFVHNILGFKNPIVIEKDIFGSWDTTTPNYPGGDVYSLVAEYENHVNWYKSAKTRVDGVGGKILMAITFSMINSWPSLVVSTLKVSPQHGKFNSGHILLNDYRGHFENIFRGLNMGSVYLDKVIFVFVFVNSKFDSWGNDRQIEEKIISTLQLNGISGTLKQLIPSFKSFRSKCETILKKYFFDDAVNEWIRDKVDSYIVLSEELGSRLKFVYDKMKIEL